MGVDQLHAKLIWLESISWELISYEAIPCIDKGKKGIENGSTLEVQSVFLRGLIEAVF